MTREEIISGLEFTIDMFLFDPSTCETFTEPRNDMDKTTIDACRGAIELLEQEPKWIPVSNPQKELPTDRVLWVTIDDDKYAQDTGGYYWLGGLVVTKLYWDMTEWSEDIVDYVLAYMDYTEPKPYKAESDDKHISGK